MNLGGMSVGAAARGREDGGGLRVTSLWRVAPGALMLLGEARERLPAAGTVLAPGGARGVFRGLELGRGEDGRRVLVAVRVPGRDDPEAGAALQLRAEDGPAVRLALPEAVAGNAEFGQAVAEAAGGQGLAVARFMLDTLRPPTDRDVSHVTTVLRAFLSRAADEDGCVEIMTAVPDSCVLLQGWGAGIEGPVTVVLAGRMLGCFAGHSGGFSRADIAAPATGVMLALPSEAAGALPGVDHVFVLSERGLHSRALVEHRLLDPAGSIGHIRHMLPTLRGPAPMLATLREAARPRYEGVDTLSADPHPVRAAVDTALAAAGAGAYLSGWVFDPLRLIASLHLCGKGGYSARLDGEWTRVPRPDVSDAFRDQAGFPKPPDADAGFAVFVPNAPASGDVPYLQFVFRDGERAFMPLPMRNPSEAGVRAALLASVDLYKPSGLAIVERHVAPLLSRVRPAAEGAARVLLRGALDRADAVVVPLASPCLPRAMLSGFLHDPAPKTEQVVFVCGPAWGQAALDALRARTEFQGLPASILLAEDMDGALGALREAARASGAERLLLAGPGVSGREAGWRQALRRTLGRAAFACPTVLYEDWSIRYAGEAGLRLTDTAPWAEPHSAMAGLPAVLASGETPVPAAMGTLECCLLGRAALEALDGDGALATEAGREAAFFLRLQALGLAGVWTPSVQVYAAEDVGELAGARVARLADGWVLREQARGLAEGA